MKRALFAILCIVAIVGAVAVPAAAGPADAGGPTLAVQDGNATDANETATNGSTANPDAPSSAESVRISPVQIDEEYLGIEVRESDSSFSTTGPVAIFSVSEPVDAARIQQPGADVRILEGQSAVLVEYSDDAAPGEEETLFEMELFFGDGSSTTIDLYATETGVSVAAADLVEYEDVIRDLEDSAADRGFEESPEGIEDLHDWYEERADLVDSFFVQYAVQLFGIGVALSMNPLAWLVFFGALAVAQWRREQTLGDYHRLIENSAGQRERQQQELEQQYKEQQIAADEERLIELPEIGPQQRQYWNDMGVTSTRQLAELARRGREVRADGGELEEPFHGVSELDAENIDDSYLAQMWSPNRLSTPKEALAHMRAALVRMDTKFGMGHEYRETKQDVDQLLSDVDANNGGWSL